MNRPKYVMNRPKRTLNGSMRFNSKYSLKKSFWYYILLLCPVKISYKILRHRAKCLRNLPLLLWFLRSYRKYSGDYFLINRDFPVISAGCSIPITLIRVGTISARHPPSRSVYFGSAFTRINGTGLVVWAVCGSPVS